MPYQTTDELIKLVNESIEKAETLRSKIPADVANLRGMSSPKIRHMINNLCSSGPCAYLEIGTYSGSTFIPALYGNECEGWAIDNFSQFKKEECDGFDAREELNKNLLNYGSNLYRYMIIAEDCFSWEATATTKKPINVFMYDGAHDAESTQKAIEIYGKQCADKFILIVDDMELADSVWEGTKQALNSFTIHKVWELKKDNGYHMGVLVSVLEKIK